MITTPPHTTHTTPQATGGAASASPVAPLSPAVIGAISTVMAEYVPALGAHELATRAAWWEADPNWPQWLVLLHQSCKDARRAWAQTTDSGPMMGEAYRETGADHAAVLAAIAYHAIERATQAAIAAWIRAQEAQEASQARYEAST